MTAFSPAFSPAFSKAFIAFAAGITQAPEIRGSALLAAIGRCIRLAKKSLDDA